LPFGERSERYFCLFFFAEICFAFVEKIHMYLTAQKLYNHSGGINLKAAEAIIGGKKHFCEGIANSNQSIVCYRIYHALDAM
jgi:hypothetical protein